MTNGAAGLQPGIALTKSKAQQFHSLMAPPLRILRLRTCEGDSSKGLPSVCPEDAGPTEAVGDMVTGSQVEMAWMRELSCARVIAPPVSCIHPRHASVAL